MNRRAVVAGTLAMLAAPRATRAQQTPRIYRVGWLGGFAIDEPLREGLRALGYVEGQNLVIEARFARGQFDRYPVLAAELVALHVDVIICPSTVATAAARAATRTIPIVMDGAANPVAEGLIASLARPGGNVTGAILQTADVTAKRMELLKATLPRLRRVAAFYPAERRTLPLVAQWLQESDAAARQLGLVLEPVDLGPDPGSWESVFAGVQRRGIDAAVIIESPTYWNGRTQLADLELRYRLAVMFAYHEHVEAGGLMSYGADTDDVHHRAASFVDRILRGARPEDLPVEQPTKFRLAINLKTAKVLGLTIPPQVLARADEIIQ